MFFVATNHVSRADPAITRTSRFDARIFVAPPGLDVKRRELVRELGTAAPEIHGDIVERALAGDDDGRSDLSPDEIALGVLALLRFDQVPELARRLRETQNPSDVHNLYTVLARMREDLLLHEWQPASAPPDWDGWDAGTKLRYVYREYVKDVSRDFSRQRLVRVARAGVSVPQSWENVSGSNRPGGDTEDEFFAPPDDLDAPSTLDGQLQLGTNPVLLDCGLLWFSVQLEDLGPVDAGA
jgi:hypothetical protein